MNGGISVNMSINGKRVVCERNLNGHFRGLHIAILDLSKSHFSESIIFAKIFDTHECSK